MPNRKLAEKIAGFMNELLEIDPDAVNAMTAVSYPCNDALAEHPTVQVSSDGFGGNCIRLIGLLNGLCGVDAAQSGLLAEVYSEHSDNLLGFVVVSAGESDVAGPSTGGECSGAAGLCS